MRGNAVSVYPYAVERGMRNMRARWRGVMMYTFFLKNAVTRYRYLRMLLSADTCNIVYAVARRTTMYGFERGDAVYTFLSARGCEYVPRRVVNSVVTVRMKIPAISQAILYRQGASRYMLTLLSLARSSAMVDMLAQLGAMARYSAYGAPRGMHRTGCHNPTPVSPPPRI